MAGERAAEIGLETKPTTREARDATTEKTDKEIQGMESELEKRYSATVIQTRERRELRALWLVVVIALNGEKI